jgi:Tat protein secretion system quality control protein TatD with DNase activity
MSSVDISVCRFSNLLSTIFTDRCHNGEGSQLALAKKFHLPLFLHSRAAHADFVKILREEGFHDGGKSVGAKGGVVHSFTGTVEEVTELVSK